MNVLEFDTGHLPAAERLAAFQMGAADFRVDAVGDPTAFGARFRLLKLGDLNAVHSRITHVHYRRERDMIEADGEDRIAIHYYLSGNAAGTLDGRPAMVGPGGAMVWDMARTIDVRTDGPVEMIIVTIPRYMADEVLPVATLAGSLPPSPELTLAAEQLRYMLDHARELEDDSAPFLGRALRDLFAVALLPSYHRTRPADEPAAPLLRRICQVIDAAPDRDVGLNELAADLDEPIEAVRRVADHFGGIDLLIERRRLLAAYRLLCDPEEIAPVSSIAERCGFDNLPRFSRRFQDVFRTSARDLRRHRAGHLPRWAGAYHVEQNYGALIAS